MTQPWNGVVWPPSESNWSPLLGGSMTSQQMRAIPAIGRGLALIEGMCMQMPMDAKRGDEILPRPRLLEQPDPTRDRAWFVGQQVDDYLVHGNAVALVTSRDATGWVASVMHVPAALVDMVVDVDGVVSYWANGVELPAGDVVHVRRGADPLQVERGLGVLEQFMRPLGRIEKQGRYEEAVLDGAAVPSVVVTTNNDKPSQEAMDAASDRWMEKFGGPVRKPLFLPAGSTAVPLSWSPADSQLVEARQLSLTDAANVLNMDAFWVGGGMSSGLTYRSPGPMWLNFLRQTAAPILEQLELSWSQAWLPRGQRVSFDRRVVLAEDMRTAVSWVSRAHEKGLITLSEARKALGYSVEIPDELKRQPVPVGLASDGQDNEVDEIEEGTE
ncbi:MAG: phage portal protein [Propionibacteriaceae bacterium]|nr:phage portal protein [Propionibacteriaceae bacterium]